VDRSPTPELQYQRTERGEILLHAIRKLRPAMRRAVELQKLQRRSLRETASSMGVSVTATKARLHHAKRELRGSLQLRAAFSHRGSSQFHLPPAA
jgi:RNA polymerase sigma factor (sigma-70 family)